MIDFSPALPTFVITLREGVEATLVVGIVLAYLKKAQQSQLNSWVYGGVASGLVASALVGVLFSWGIQLLGTTSQNYQQIAKPLMEAIFGVVAIAMLSWMLVWMTQQAKLLKRQVEGVVNTALAGNGAGWGIWGLVFVAVLREGFETVIFIAAKFQQGWIQALGAAAGIVVAIAIGALLFRWGVQINLRLFFQIMGVFLLLIVAGLVTSALRHFDLAISNFAQMHGQTETLCLAQGRLASCILGPKVWDTTAILPDRQFPGIILHTLFGYTDQLYLVQALGYLLFLTVVGGIYWQSITGWSILAGDRSVVSEAANSPQK